MDLAGEVEAQTGPVSYLVKVDHETRRCHIDQLLERSSNAPKQVPRFELDESFGSTGIPVTSGRDIPEPSEPVVSTRRYPSRNRRPPDVSS